jgi:penicillin-binding protein 1A
MAEALTRSRNVPTLKLQEQVGVNRVIDMARKFGLTAAFGPYLSLSLGVMDISVWEIVRAYTVFPNQGVLTEPHLLREVYDRRGRMLERTQRDSRVVMDADDAYVLARMLVAGIERGTGVRAKPLARELGTMLGGKSGTTDDRTDVWYVGFSPHHTVGVWVGNDLKERIARNATGSTAALPIWMEVMAAAEQGLPGAALSMPANIEIRRVDPRTGLLHGPFCDEAVELAYLAGTGPTRVCGHTEHNILALPYYQQTYFLNQGRIDTGGS